MNCDTEEFYEVFQCLVRSDMTVSLYKIVMHFCTYFAKYASERKIFPRNVGMYDMQIVCAEHFLRKSYIFRDLDKSDKYIFEFAYLTYSGPQNTVVFK
jgi:hypothetical protein